MEIANSVVDFGCLVVAGFVRDVYIRKEQSFNDIDIVCQLSRRGEFLEHLKEKWKDVTVSKSDSVCETHIPFCKYIEIIHIFKYKKNEVKLEVMYYENIKDWLRKESSVDFTHSLFYLSKDGLGLQYLPDGYTREELLQLIHEKQFKYLQQKLKSKESTFHVNNRIVKFQNRGWKLVF
jgi:hypothetical protein